MWNQNNFERFVYTFFFGLLGCLSLKSQNIPPNWQGILTQSTVEGSLASSYSYWLELEFINDSVFARSRIEIANTPQYGIVMMKGIVRENLISLEGYKIQEGNVEEFGVRWCLIKTTLRYEKGKGKLSGLWRGNSTCGNGKLTLFLSNSPLNDSTSQSNEYVELSELNSGNLNNKKLILEDVQFENNSSTLDNADKLYLKKIIEYLIANPELKIKILGHTDNVGKTEDNLLLSIERATSVQVFMMENGIANERITIEGYGESRPLKSNDTAEGRKASRRIEIEFQ